MVGFRFMTLQHMRKRLTTLTSAQTVPGFWALAKTRSVINYLWSKIPSIAFAEGHSLGREEGEEARWAWLGESCWRKICFQGRTLTFLKLLIIWWTLNALIFNWILLRGWSLGVWRETWGNTKCSRSAIQWDRARWDKNSRKISSGSFIS